MGNTKPLDSQFDVVVIGAGMSGLTVATALKNEGKKVLVLDKARGSGGRLSSKRLKVDQDKSVSFDLGCNTFSAETTIFREQVKKWIDHGCAESINGEGCLDVIVGVPRNSSITRFMADSLDVRFSSLVVNISRTNKQWLCELDDENAPSYLADTIVLALPPQQLANLLPQGHARKNDLSEIHMQAQWVLMLELDETVDLSTLDLGGHLQAVEKIYCDSNKPDRKSRAGRKNWLIHASPSWTEDNLDMAHFELASALIERLEGALNYSLNVYSSHVHRWLYSTSTGLVASSQPYIDLGSQLYGCGDWLGDQYPTKGVRYGGVEAAYLSGSSLATQIATTF